MTADEKRNRTAVLSAGAMVLIAAVITFRNFAPGKRFSQSTLYFTDDGARSWYVDSNTNIPPYQHNGRPAVGVALYRTEKNSTPFCGYLFRFPMSVQTQLNNMAPAQRVFAAYSSITSAQMEVCSPGSNGPWVTVSTPAANKVMTIQSPDGSELDRVLP